MKLTPIFPPHIKPVREGVYRVHQFSGIPEYSYWNGRFWGLRSFNPDLSYQFRKQRSYLQDKRWRGLARGEK